MIDFEVLVDGDGAICIEPLFISFVLVEETIALANKKSAQPLRHMVNVITYTDTASVLILGYALIFFYT